MFTPHPLHILPRRRARTAGHRRPAIVLTATSTSMTAAAPTVARPRTRVRREAPSLVLACAQSLLIALCAALAMLGVMARALHAHSSPSQAPAIQGPRTTPSTKADSGIGAALRRSADRHGLWGSVGVGRARAGLDCDACSTATSGAYAVHGTIGVRITPRFLAGAETFAWLDVIGGGVDRIVRGTHLIGRSYPFSHAPVFLQGGVGVASFEVNDGDVAFLTRSASLSLAAGVDWHVAGMTVTPTIAAVTTTGGKLTSDRTGNAVTDNARLGLLRTSVALSWFR